MGDLVWFLEQHGLGAVAAAIEEASGAESVRDLLELDADGLQAVFTAVPLKPVQASKLPSLARITSSQLMGAETLLNITAFAAGLALTRCWHVTCCMMLASSFSDQSRVQTL